MAFSARWLSRQRRSLPREPPSCGSGSASYGVLPVALSDIHVLVADGHAFVADTFAAYLTTRAGARVSKAASVAQALALVEAAEDISLALLDLHMPDMDGVMGFRCLRDRRPDLPVAILSGDASAEIARRVLDAGANGFILKSMGGPAILAAIRLILAGERYVPANLLQAEKARAAAPAFTQREHEVLGGLVDGRSNKEIASTMQISAATVALHLTNVYRKLNVASRGQAVRRAFELGLRTDRRDR